MALRVAPMIPNFVIIVLSLFKEPALDPRQRRKHRQDRAHRRLNHLEPALGFLLAGQSKLEKMDQKSPMDILNG